MHVLFIPSWYSTPTEPVRGSFFREQALALQKAGHRVGMLVPPGKLRTWHGLSEVRHHWQRANTDVTVEDDSGIATYRVPWWGWWLSIYPWGRGEFGVQVFDRYCREQGSPDVVHGHSVLYGGYLAAYIGHRRRVPCVLTEHSPNYQQRYIFPDQGYFVRYTLRHLDRRFAVSPPLAQALGRYAPEQTIEILPNVVDTAFFSPGTDDFLERPFVFAVVGSLSRRKGHDVLLKAFSAEFGGQEDVLVYVAGEGRLRKKLEALIDELGLQRQVTLLGMLPREGVRDLIRRSHAVISSSYAETFGVSLIEAMACGKPVVATCSGGPEWFVNETNGLLVPKGDPVALAVAMRQLVQQYDRYDPVQIRADTSARFSEAAFLKQIETIYQEVVAEGNRRPRLMEA
jgi:glycosyltransferase involved in cell wall biosynthesis